VAFWTEWFATEGSRWPESYKERLDPARPLQPAVRSLLPVAPGGTVRILDVGAGPLTFLGKRWDGRRVEITAVDALAAEYDRIMADAGVDPLVRTLRCETERLTGAFAPGSFDVVTASNTLDHSYDPLRAIEQMIEVVRPGGAVYLTHCQNEAEHERYDGLHQWNLLVEDGRFTVWNEEARRDVGHLVADRATLERAEPTTGRWHEVVLRRRG
jgi:SAM-dependent methyltransferase